MTVLQVLPSLHSGGVERGTIDIAKALVAKGFCSLVLSSGGPMVKTLERSGTKHITLPVHSKNPIQIWLNSKEIIKLINEHNIDLVHVRSRAPAWSVYLASRATNTPYITTFHGAYGHQNKLKRWYNSAMLKGSHTIAVSDFIAKHIQETYPTYVNNSSIIHRGIDTHTFDPNLSDSEKLALQKLKDQWQIPPNKIVILLPGRLTRIKGHHLLLEALTKINIQDIYTLIVGDEPGKGQYREELQNKIKRLNLSNSVRLTGHHDDMKLAYALSDIVISASIKPESFGRISCEAQAMKKLVIASRHGGSKETISPELQCLMFQPNSAEDLANSINKAIDMFKNNASSIVIKSRYYIESKFTLAKMCSDTLKLYELELSKNKSHHDSDLG